MVLPTLLEQQKQATSIRRSRSSTSIGGSRRGRTPSHVDRRALGSTSRRSQEKTNSTTSIHPYTVVHTTFSLHAFLRDYEFGIGWGSKCTRSRVRCFGPVCGLRSTEDERLWTRWCRLGAGSPSSKVAYATHDSQTLIWNLFDLSVSDARTE